LLQAPFLTVYNEEWHIISDTGILQDLARVMIQDCCYDVSNMLSCIT